MKDVTVKRNQEYNHMEFIGGRSHRMAAWTHIRERENEDARTTEDGSFGHNLIQRNRLEKDHLFVRTRTYGYDLSRPEIARNH